MAKGMSRYVFVSVLAILALSLLSHASYATGSLIAYIYPDGFTLLTYNLTIDYIPSKVSIYVPSNASLISVYVNGEPIPYSYDSISGKIEFVATSSKASINVYHGGLTSKTGLIWRFTLPKQDYETIIILPEGSVIVAVEPRNFKVKVVDNRIVLQFSPGYELKLEYIIVPQTITPTHTPPLTHTQTTSTGEARRINWIIPILIIALVAISVLGLLAYKMIIRPKPPTSIVEPTTVEDALDERDKAIIEALRKHGELTAQEIQRITGIPKTPLYRKLEKLEKYKIIAYTIKGGVKVYRLA